MLAALQGYAALCAPWPPKGCRTSRSAGRLAGRKSPLCRRRDSTRANIVLRCHWVWQHLQNKCMIRPRKTILSNF